MFQKVISNTAAIYSAAALSALTLPSPNAEASELDSLSKYQMSLDLAQDPMFWNAVAVKIDVNGTILVGSGVAVAPNLVIGAAHFTPSATSTATVEEVIFGANYNSPNAMHMEVDHWERVSTYIPGNTGTIDLGFYWLKDFFPGFTAPITISASAQGQILTQVDFGNYGDPTSGELPSLGDKMAGFAPRVNYSPTSTYPDSLYDYLDFQGSSSFGLSINAKGLNFSSGSPWFNEEGDLTHISIAATTNFDSGYTVALDLTAPSVQAELMPRIQKSWDAYNNVPEPGSAAMLTLGGTLLALQRFRKKS